jgi:hypothetical protein
MILIQKIPEPVQVRMHPPCYLITSHRISRVALALITSGKTNVRAAEELLRRTYRSRPLYETHVDQPRAAQWTSPKYSSHIQSLLDLRVLERWDVDDHVYCGTYFVEEGITGTARPIFNGFFLPVPSVCPPVDLLPV